MEEKPQIDPNQRECLLRSIWSADPREPQRFGTMVKAYSECFGSLGEASRTLLVPTVVLQRWIDGNRIPRQAFLRASFRLTILLRVSSW